MDGSPVTVSVSTTWLAAPSRVPLAVGAAAGLAAVLLALARRARLAWALLAVSVAAGGVGYWQFRSVPSETGPLLVWWLLPAVAAGSLLVALLLGRRLVSYALVLLAALELAVWVWLRRDARLPGDHPDGRAVLARPRCAGGDRRRRGRRRRRRRGGDVPHAQSVRVHQ